MRIAFLSILAILSVNGAAIAQTATPIKPGPVNPTAPKVNVVTTGGVAVTAFAAGQATAGGWVATANSAGICVDQVTTAGTATGTPSTTGCVAANVPFYLVPSTNAVSVNSSASSVTFGGEAAQ